MAGGRPVVKTVMSPSSSIKEGEFLDMLSGY